MGGLTDRRTLLAVTSEIPWPLDSGGHLRTYHLLRALTDRFDVTLVVPSARPDDDAVTALGGAGVRLRVVAVPPRTAVSEIVRVAAAALRREPYVLYARHRHRAVRQALRAEAMRRPPDVLYLDHLDSLVYAGVAPGARIVVDMHNVYSHLATRTAAEARGRARKRYLVRQSALLRQRERAAGRTAHTLMAVSASDARYFSSIGAPRVVLVPNGVDCAAFERAPATVHDSRTILYVGSLEWPPNVSAARFLARDVLPAVRTRVPDASLLLVGKNPTAEVLALANAADHVHVAANVPDVVPYFHMSSVLAVPLEAGGGTRLKILEAFAAGLPVISTPVGCEGIAARHQEHLIVAGRWSFADEITRLLLDPRHARGRVLRARALARQEYDWRAVGRRAAEAVATAAADRQKAEPAMPELAVGTGMSNR